MAVSRLGLYVLMLEPDFEVLVVWRLWGHCDRTARFP